MSESEKKNKLKIDELNEKLKIKFEKIFWRYYKIEDIDDFEFDKNFFISPTPEILNSYDLKTEWGKCKEIHDKIKTLEKDGFIHDLQCSYNNLFDVKSLPKLKHKIPELKLKKIIKYQFIHNKILLFDACTKETKKLLLEKVLSMGTTSVFFTYKAAQLFINEDCFERLNKNNCLIDDSESETFIKSINLSKEKLKSHKDFVEGLGLYDFYSKDYTEFDGFIQSIILSTDQKYTSYVIQEPVRNFYDFNINRSLHTLKGLNNSGISKIENINNDIYSWNYLNNMEKVKRDSFNGNKNKDKFNMSNNRKQDSNLKINENQTKKEISREEYAKQRQADFTSEFISLFK